MKGTSKVIMGATLVMVVSLAIVLALVLVLLAELYCTLLLRRRRQLRNNSSSATPTATTSSTTPTATSTTTFSPTTNNTSSSQPQQHQNQSPPPPPPPPLSSFYAHGVIQAPRNLFFPAVKENKTQESNTNPHFINISPHQIQETQTQTTKPNPSPAEHFIYISNPIYDNDGNRPSRVLVDDTPYETPDSSPSRLETGTGSSSSSGDEEEEITSSPLTPPLTPMKKLPAEASSVSLRDAKSLGTSSSSVSNYNGLSSSSSSGSPRTSPSWRVHGSVIQASIPC